MKKNYEKPEIMFDSFELSQSIAGGCELIQTNQAEKSCPINIPDFGPGYTWFADLLTCYATPPGPNDSICYHVPSDAYNVYSS